MCRCDIHCSVLLVSSWWWLFGWCLIFILFQSSVEVCNGWMTQRIDIPIVASSAISNDAVVSSFEAMVFNCPYMEESKSNNDLCTSCTIIPSLENAKIQLLYPSLQDKTSDDNNDNSNKKMVLEINACTKQDVLFLCQQINQLWNIPFKRNLHQLIAEYYNSQPPFPGISATNNNNGNCKNQYFHSLLSSHLTPSKLNTLKKDGFITVSFSSNHHHHHDSLLEVTEEALDLLSKRVSLQKTTQSKSVRSDSVVFLSYQDTMECQLQEPYSLLMSIPSYLNQYYRDHFPHSSHPPLPPATIQNPLTLPKTLQAAQYQFGEFYKEHRYVPTQYVRTSSH